MARGISINIGVNNLSDHYSAEVFGTLKSCINDANEMANIAEFMNFEKPIVLHNAEVDTVKTHIRAVAAELKSGDICFLTFSGHGGQREDENLDETDSKQMDETWCLHDRQMIDDEFLDLWTDFKEGVRILVVSDSCHSGTIVDFLEILKTTTNKILLSKEGFDFKGLENLIFHKLGLKSIDLKKANINKNSEILKKLKLEDQIDFVLSDVSKLNLFEQKVKTLPQILLQKVFSDNKKIYDETRSKAKDNLQKKLRDSDKENFRDLNKASILLLSACQDWQKTNDGKEKNDNSVFTEALIEIWDKDKFQGNYVEFHEAIYNKLKTEGRKQIPNIYPTGIPNAKFKQQKPFKVQFP